MTKPAESLDDQVATELAHSEVRYTKGRRALVSILARAGRPLTTPEIVALGADLPTSSLYRNLDVLEQAGIVKRVVSLGDRAYFELSERLLDHHHHLICECCGLIVDVEVDESIEVDITARLGAIAAARGFVPAFHSLDLYGLCAECSNHD